MISFIHIHIQFNLLFIALFTANFSRLQYSVFERGCEQFRVRIANLPELPHIHVQNYCNAKGKKGYWTQDTSIAVL